MNKPHLETVYQPYLGNDALMERPPRGSFEIPGDGGDGYGINGEDLRVESYSDRLDYALGLKELGEKVKGYNGDRLRQEADELLHSLHQEAVTMRDELKQRLDELSEKDEARAHAIQDWTLAELEQRIAERGYDYAETDERTYHETVDVLDTLVDELKEDNEDKKLIALARAWRDEVSAELTVKQVESAYGLAA